MISLNNIGKARAKATNKEENVVVKSLYRLVENNKLKAQESSMLRYLGDILLNIDDHQLSEAENCIKKALETDKRNGTILYLANDYELYAEFFKRKGDPLKAKEYANKAIEIYKKCGADGWLNKIEKQFSSLS